MERARVEGGLCLRVNGINRRAALIKIVRGKRTPFSLYKVALITNLWQSEEGEYGRRRAPTLVRYFEYDI